MPNWVDNIVTICGDVETLNQIMKEVQSKDDFFDFDKIIPMPPHSETFYRDGGLGLEEQKKYGKNNWYDWSIENWGTKWNSCESRCDGIVANNLSYLFQTAWSPAKPVIKALAKKYKVKIELVFIDENTGCNCGKIAFNENGEVIEDIYYSDNGFDFIASIYGKDYLYNRGYVKKHNKWQYVD